MVYYNWDQIAMCIATGVNQLTAWRNADVKLATGELIAADKFKSCFLTLPTIQTSRRGTGNFIRTRDNRARTLGRYIGTHYLQTAQFAYWVMQACSTTENTPAGYNTHAVTLNSSVTPLNFGIHFQHKLSGNDLLWDALGVLPRELRISCGEQQHLALQSLSVDYSYKASSDDITKTDKAEGTTGTIVKNWNHAVAGGLGANQTAFTYNSNAVECDITGIEITLKRNTGMHARDSNGYPTVGEMYDFDWNIILNVIPNGDDIWSIMQLDKADYAGDLDLNFKFQADATNDYIQYNFDKSYLVPTTKEASYDKYTDSFQIALEPMSDSSSLAITGIDSHNNDHYENP